MKQTMFSLVVAVLWGSSLGICYAGTPGATGACGGSRASIGMTISIIQRQGSARKHAVSLVSLNAIIASRNSGQPIAWLGIDDLGSRWIEFGKNGSDLRSALGSSVKKFNSGIFDLWPSGALPNGYLVTTCSRG